MRHISRTLRNAHFFPHRHWHTSIIRRPQQRLLTSVRDEFRKRTRYSFQPSTSDLLLHGINSIVGTALILWFFASTFKLLAADISKEDLEKAQASQAQRKKDREEQEELEEIVIPDATPPDGMFFAFQLPKRIFREGLDNRMKRDDPDWQNIIAFCEDKEGIMAVRDDIIKEVTAVASSKQFTRYVGKDLRCTRAWLDLLPEAKIPVEYQRYGLEFNPQAHALYPIQRQIDAVEKNKVMSIFYPESLVESTYVFFRTLQKLQGPKIKAAWEARKRKTKQREVQAELAISSSLPGDFDTSVDRDATALAAKRVEQEKNAPVPKASEITKIALPGASPPSPPVQPTPQKAAGKDAKKNKKSYSLKEVADDEDGSQLTLPLRRYRRKLLAPWTPGSDFSKAARVAIHQLMDDAHGREVVMRRGDILIKGYVELVGGRGHVQFSVWGFVDAKTRDLRLIVQPELLRSPPPTN